MDLKDFKDYFKILGIGRAVKDIEIKNVFRKLAKNSILIYFLTIGKQSQNLKKLVKLMILSDREKKKFYDKYLSYHLDNININSIYSPGKKT